VAYIDSDPVVLLHAEALLAGAPSVRVVTADVRRPAEILDSDQVRGFIDFGRPVGLLMLAILHHFSDEEDPAGIVPLSEWRPDVTGQAARNSTYYGFTGGVARKL